MSAIRWLVCMVAALLPMTILLPVAQAAEGDYPNKVVRLIVPFPAGSQSDVIARAVGAKLAAQINQQVVIDNRPGGGTAGWSRAYTPRGEPGSPPNSPRSNHPHPPNLSEPVSAIALEMKTFAILAFGGGRCKELAEVPIHFPIHDMQIAEDLQMIVGHMIMQRLCSKPRRS